MPIPGLIEGAFIGMGIAYTVSAAVGALPPPRNEYTFYSWFYKFLHQETNLLNAYMQNKYHLPSDGITAQVTTKTDLDLIPKSQENTK